MQQKPIVLFEARDTRENLEVMRSFVARHFRELSLCLLYITGPFVILGGIALGSIHIFDFALAKSHGMLATKYAVLMLSSLVLYLFSTLTISSFVALYEESGEQEKITPDKVWKRIRQELPRMIPATLLISLLLVVAFIAFVLPGMYLSIPLQFTFFILVREHISFSAALKKGLDLIRGEWWTSFFYLLVLYLVGYVISFFFQAPHVIIQVWQAFTLAGGSAEESAYLSDRFSLLSVLSGILSMAGNVLMSSLIFLGLIFQYYSLTEKKEGAGLLTEIALIGKDREDLQE